MSCYKILFQDGRTNDADTLEKAIGHVELETRTRFDDQLVWFRIVIQEPLPGACSQDRVMMRAYNLADIKRPMIDEDSPPLACVATVACPND